MSRIDERFATLRRAGRKGLVTYVTAGDPDLATSYEILKGLPKAGADVIELGAVKRLFGQQAYKLSMSSTKSSIGHLLGAAGSVEAIFCMLALRDQVAPPTLNLETPDEGCDIDLVPNKAKQRSIKKVLTNSFGFGGTNASVVLSRLD